MFVQTFRGRGARLGATLSLALTLPAVGQTNTWVGGNGVVSDPTGWSLGAVPVDTNAVIIQPSAGATADELLDMDVPLTADQLRVLGAGGHAVTLRANESGSAVGTSGFTVGNLLSIETGGHVLVGVGNFTSTAAVVSVTSGGLLTTNSTAPSSPQAASARFGSVNVRGTGRWNAVGQGPTDNIPPQVTGSVNITGGFTEAQNGLQDYNLKVTPKLQITGSLNITGEDENSAGRVLFSGDASPNDSGLDVQGNIRVGQVGRGLLRLDGDYGSIRAARLDIGSGGILEVTGGDHNFGLDVPVITNAGLIDTKGSDYLGSVTNEKDLRYHAQSPGLSSTSHPSLFIQDTFVQTADGRLSIDFNAWFVRFDFTWGVEAGALNLAGTLTLDNGPPEDVLDAVGDLDSFYGRSHTLLEGDTARVGTFDRVEDVRIHPDLSWAITYTDTDVILTAALPGDVNLDGAIGQADLDAVLLSWGDPQATWATGDLDGNGLVDQADLDEVLLRWGDAVAYAGVPVPEPVAGLLMAGVLMKIRPARRANDRRVTKNLQ